ncbi:hypothetical protein [Labedaea rhizosphaerae]|uniref:Uncharacterized protein n=1 Tax=Labedaea rhizosphaerae TaxID=598644 RepID=A0A4R6RU83_LABRH|nr:hypothetical protein [Labedaea rhizosphaerae]TDP89907.1 hypothetical protein EV186_11133 [Labedaea rhizosphaerae]
MAATQAWPFLVARGRDRGYSVLLAPEFLIADGDYGFLEEQAVPSHTDAVHVADGQSARGRRVCLVWTEQVVSAEDAGTEEAPRDAHSRPLRLLFGFVSSAVVSPAATDLEQARDAALRTYRRFLADEAGFTVESSAPFAMRSAVTASETPVSDTPRSRRFTVPAVVGGVVAAAAIVLAVLVAWPSPEPPKPLPPCGTTLTPTPRDAPTNCTTPTTTAPRPKKRAQRPAGPITHEATIAAGGAPTGGTR